jgi:hypothetical protein
MEQARLELLALENTGTVRALLSEEGALSTIIRDRWKW